jgi:hypothetical protein
VQNSQVREHIGTNQGSRYFGVIGVYYFQALAVFHHMVVGDDIPLFADDHA